jgi:hypothetical protein
VCVGLVVSTHTCREIVRESLSQSFSLRIGVHTPTVGPEYWELLSDANLRMFGKSCQDIAKVEYRQHYPG